MENIIKFESGFLMNAVTEGLVFGKILAEDEKLGEANSLVGKTLESFQIAGELYMFPAENVRGGIGDFVGVKLKYLKSLNGPQKKFVSFKYGMNFFVKTSITFHFMDALRPAINLMGIQKIRELFPNTSLVMLTDSFRHDYEGLNSFTFVSCDPYNFCKDFATRLNNILYQLQLVTLDRVSYVESLEFFKDDNSPGYLPTVGMRTNIRTDENPSREFVYKTPQRSDILDWSYQLCDSIIDAIQGYYIHD